MSSVNAIYNTFKPAFGQVARYLGAAIGIVWSDQIDPPRTLDQTTNYTLQPADFNQTLVFTSATALNIIVAFDLPINFQVAIVQGGAGQLNIVPATNVTVNNRQSQTHTNAQYAVVSLTAIAQDSYILAGDTG